MVGREKIIKIEIENKVGKYICLFGKHGWRLWLAFCLLPLKLQVKLGQMGSVTGCVTI